VHAPFRALADPTRRAILRRLRDGPRTSGEIAAEFPIAWASVSRHLGVLRDAELVLAERDGQQIVYSLNTTVLHDVVEHLLELAAPREAPDARDHTRDHTRDRMGIPPKTAA